MLSSFMVDPEQEPEGTGLRLKFRWPLERSLVPRPHPQKREKVWRTLSDFFIVLIQRE